MYVNKYECMLKMEKSIKIFEKKKSLLIFPSLKNKRSTFDDKFLGSLLYHLSPIGLSLAILFSNWAKTQQPLQIISSSIMQHFLISLFLLAELLVEEPSIRLPSSLPLLSL